MKPINGVMIVICNFVLSIILYWVLKYLGIVVSFGDLFFPLVLVDLVYYILKPDCEEHREGDELE